MKLGNGRMPKVEVETVLDDDDETIANSYFPDEPADKTEMPEQDVVDDDGKPIDGLDHIVDSYINMEVKLPHKDKRTLWNYRRSLFRQEWEDDWNSSPKSIYEFRLVPSQV